MPELPEVETIKRQLDRTIKGAIIKDVKIKNVKSIESISKEKFIKAVRGAKISDVSRRAKLLILNLSNKNNILFHLKMTGRMLLVGKKEASTKHTHIIFELSGSHNLFFEDYRKFGFARLMTKGEMDKYFSGEAYGPEPLSKNFNYKTMKACLLAYPTKKIKSLLMEQSCIAGIGNIYASEICFYARVHPERKVKDIKEVEFKKLYEGTKEILRSAISSGGSSSDSYIDAYGKKGKFVPKLKVYGREGEDCIGCSGKVKKYKLAGRGTYFCPSCQK
ncbi:bifunctional DNA-formamidopyrimidine glycosylase/DNA-(apurinic or apyrimidinic site) lyase [Candidatus Parcubacteria bacterium]|nr:bifunctional DNA-formamidopyrimidine glycosylase/DNA-(apurinic or apyrimidinic site) lyase [Candidatus Parcubacteria bacterium]